MSLDTGILDATSGVTFSNFAGDVAWSSPNNITASDNVRATAALNTGAANKFSEALEAFWTTLSAIPDGATILGIEIFVEWGRTTGTGTPQDFEAVLSKTGAPVGTDKATNTTKTTEAVQTYGGAADLWGTTWTPAELKASTFSFYFIARNSSGVATCTVGVDNIQIRVTYDPPAGLGLAIMGVGA